MFLRITNVTRGTELGTGIGLANTFWQRLKGLLGTRSLLPGQGLLISPCDSIHMFGMQYAIDVAFLNSSYRVIKIVSAIPPGKATSCPGSSHALELPAGTLLATHTAVGDQLQITQNP